ncbi:MAG: nitrogenase [Methanophagales archaeon]|nr:nitrogenase [Methanophagales archaeon]
MRSVTINPAKMCQPIGAMYALFGVHAAVPLVHGSQGCTAYPMRMFNRHFGELVQVAVSSLGEDASVFGGKKNLVVSIENIIARRHPELIGVITTCLSETIGDDIDGIIREGNFEDSKVVPIHTPSYVGSHVTGYDNALKALVTTLSVESDSDNAKGKLDIVPGMVNPGDVLEIKQMLDSMNISYTILSDISETLNAPLILPKPPFPRGGSSVAEIEDCAKARGVIALCEHAGGSAAVYLKGKYGMAADTICPIGVANTDKFLDAVCDMTGTEIPYSLEQGRGRLIDAMVDVHMKTCGKRAAIFADPDIALALAEFVTELGMEPVIVSSSTASRKFLQKAKSVTDGEILNGRDLYELQRAVKDNEVDILFGNTKCTPIAKDEDAAFVRCGFPVYDRVGYHRYGIMGYHGGMYLTDMITNAILEWGERG